MTRPRTDITVLVVLLVIVPILGVLAECAR
jgi:hypothetical protein